MVIPSFDKKLASAALDDAAWATEIGITNIAGDKIQTPVGKLGEGYIVHDHLNIAVFEKIRYPVQDL